MLNMFVTVVRSQLPMGWLNAVKREHATHSVTAEFQSPISWLKDEAVVEHDMLPVTSRYPNSDGRLKAEKHCGIW